MKYTQIFENCFPEVFFPFNFALSEICRIFSWMVHISEIQQLREFLETFFRKISVPLVPVFKFRKVWLNGKRPLFCSLDVTWPWSNQWEQATEEKNSSCNSKVVYHWGKVSRKSGWKVSTAFRVVGKFPGATENLKGSPVFADRLFQFRAFEAVFR